MLSRVNGSTLSPNYHTSCTHHHFSSTVLSSPETLNDINALADLTDTGASVANGPAVANAEASPDASASAGSARTKRDASLLNELDGESTKEIISITLNIKGYQFEPES
uniref:Uncharacterized protein n=1 Tax=Anopheles epiroticus TaxID=199890 RepID=A0A182PNB0_9DIPT